jgi:HTTM domain
VRPKQTWTRRAFSAWLSFWFPGPAPRGQLALIRIGTALILLYALFVRSFDLQAGFSQAIWSDPATREALDPIGWPFSVFRWVDGAWWLWSMHVLAMLVAAALLAGVVTPLTAALSLLFQLSYAHANPAMLLGLDGLLMLALFYLSLVPSGYVLGVFGTVEPDRPRYPPYLAYLEDELPRRPEAGLPWSGLPVRMLQIHMTLLYLHSGLSKLTTDWLAGTPLWHPRLVAMGALVPLQTLQAVPYLTSLITYGLVLFELFYGVLVWVRPIRYPLLGLALLVHLTVGIAWGLLPFNLLMIVLNLVFVPPEHLEALVRFIRPLLVLPWVANEARE